ncbi:MAG: hypothetical protein J6U90_03695 [Methanobrevibacter sp.]|nr:hypothetical protein [Methanobrevibacter sp.]
MKVSKSEFVEILLRENECTIEVQTNSSVKMNKKGNPLKDSNVTKQQSFEAIFGRNYEKMVNESASNNDICKEGEQVFKSQKLPYGEWVEGGVDRVIKHTNKEGKEKFYIRCYNPIYKSTEYYVNGLKATKEEEETIKSFIPNKKSESQSQKEIGLEKEHQVSVNNIDFDNIVEINVNGIVYKID